MLPKRACDLCYSKKISCDRSDQHVACDWCRHHQLACTFNRVRARKRNPRPRIENSVFAVESSLSSQLQPINFVLDRVMLDQASSSTSSNSSSSSAEESLSGPSDILTGSVFQQDDPLTPSIPLTCNDPSQPDDGPDSLDKETALQTLQLFNNSSVRYVLPLIDPILFRGTLELAYSSEETHSSQQLQAQASVLALASVMSLIEDSAPSPSYSLGVKCASQALALLDSTSGAASLLTLQAVSLLRIHGAFSGEIPASLQIHKTACRLVKELGGHTTGPGKPGNTNSTYSEREYRELRTLFWQSYITDKHITLRTGMEPCLDDSICDLTLPDDCGFPKGYPLPGSKDGRMPSLPYGVLSPCLGGDIQLSILKSKVWQLLYSPEARQRSEAELLWAVRELDGEVEAWRMSVPAEMRPTFLIADKSRISPPKIDMPSWVRPHATTLHLEYHNLFITIHQASARYQFSKGSDTLMQAWSTSVQSSITLALEASRSTLLYLETVLDRLAKETFWICIHYPIVALRTLFVNIVANPSGPDAESDLRLLCSTHDLIKRMPMSKRLVHGEAYVQKIEEEISGLVQYAQSLMSCSTGSRH